MSELHASTRTALPAFEDEHMPGWIFWHGCSDLPPTDKEVTVLLRNGQQIRTRDPDKLRWYHQESVRDHDIIGYQIVRNDDDMRKDFIERMKQFNREKEE